MTGIVNHFSLILKCSCAEGHREDTHTFDLMTFYINDHSLFAPIDGSSTERGPSTTTASASASNVTS